jgi:hypothetical protein
MSVGEKFELAVTRAYSRRFPKGELDDDGTEHLEWLAGVIAGADYLDGDCGGLVGQDSAAQGLHD